jgi:hypothetical protein
MYSKTEVNACQHSDDDIMSQVARSVTEKFDELFRKTTFAKRKVLAGIVMMTPRDAAPRVLCVSTGKLIYPPEFTDPSIFCSMKYWYRYIYSTEKFGTVTICCRNVYYNLCIRLLFCLRLVLF